MYNLTESRQISVKWMVAQVRAGNLKEEFTVIWNHQGPAIFGFKRDDKDITPIPLTDGGLAALTAGQLIITTKIQNRTKCVLTGKAYEAVDSNFGAPDTSFIKYLTPLADVSGFDKEILERCLPILGPGNDAKHWDNAVRQAFLILEERLRSVSGVPASDKNTSENLVNKVFGEASTLITDSKQRTYYRNLFSGMFTVFRNEYGHRFVDPTPEDGGAIIRFINLLLKMLEDLRLSPNS